MGGPRKRACDRLLLGGLLLLTACGRLGYDELSAPSGGDGGPGGDGGGGGAIDGGGLAASDAGAIVPDGCLIVTTAADEDDAGESPTAPHLGAGLSLREAIALTDAAPGPDCVALDAPRTIALGSTTLAIDDTLALYGNGSTLVSQNGMGVGLVVNAAGVELRDLAVEDFGVGVEVNGADARVGPGFESRACDVGFRFAAGADGGVVSGARFRQSGGPGLVINADGVTVELARVDGNGGPGVDTAGISGLVLRHVTVDGNSSGLDFRANPTGVEVINTILTHNAGAGLDASGGTEFQATRVLAFGNGAGPCSGCSLGPTAILADPRFVDRAAGDLRLAADSPALDAGDDTGLDVNGAAPGTHNGAGPDLGALER